MGKQLHLCATACFLLSVLVFSCQTERKANDSPSTVAAKQKSDKTSDIAAHNATVRKYYAANNRPVARIPLRALHLVAAMPERMEQPAIIKVPNVVSDVAYASEDEPANNPTEDIAPQTHEITIIIKDSVTQKDPDMTFIAKTDTIQFREPDKAEDGSEAELSASEEAAPLSPEEMDTVISKYAEMISVDRSEMSNFNLYLFIDEWYGTRYKFGGTDSTGIDCSAFSQKLYGKVYGVDILRTAKQQHRHAEHVKYPDDANEGDLVFFRIHRLRVSHVGVYLANGYFVHSSSSKGVVISNLNDKYWRRRFAGCGRIPREEKSITESDYLQ